MLSTDLVRSVLDSAPDAMIFIDAGGRIVFANRQVAALFGHEPVDIIGAEVEILLPERFRARHSGHRDGYTRNIRLRPMGAGLDLFGMRKDGTEFPVEISLSPISQAGQTLVAAAIRDVTERKQVELELRDARREADHANLAKSRFLATASHDLRQPLQTLGLLNGALRRMIHDDPCREVLQQQNEAIDAMSRLLNALLDISKLESGAIKLEPTNFAIAPLLEELKRDFSGVAASKGLRLTLDSPRVYVHSDPALLGQLLRNLVSNAVKYTQRGTVELKGSSREGKLRLEVRDTGVGIPGDQIGLIFEEFYQIGVSPNSSRDGYGLGLSIVRRIVKLLDIRIDVSSEPGRGSVFAIELPMATAGAEGAAAEIAAEPVPAQVVHRLLLVEDDPGVRNAMRMFLDMEGFEVSTAASAEEAHRLLRAEKFDLMITDYHLNLGATGTQVIAAARELLGPDFKAVLVTGDTSTAVRELRGDAHLRITSKPINSEELLSMIRSLVVD
jgi:two-component system, sensor histidine kinase